MYILLPDHVVFFELTGSVREFSAEMVFHQVGRHVGSYDS